MTEQSMMTCFLAYNLKVGMLVAVFYMFYRLLLSRETFHRVNRMVLIGTAVLSFVLPLCVVTMHQTVTLPAPLSIPEDIINAPKGVEAPSGTGWGTVWGALALLYLAGMALTLGHTLLSTLRVWQLIRHSEHYPQADGTVIAVTRKAVSPFSWMHFIVLSPGDYEEHNDLILAHERAHIRQRHSLDLLLVDSLTALQWFNPAMWMLRQDLRAIHEYEADRAVLSQGINMRQYQYLLIQKAMAANGYSVANGISQSTLKYRINMMLNNKKHKRAGMLKLLALLPIVGTVLALQAETVTDYVYKDAQPQQKKKIVVAKNKDNGKLEMKAKTVKFVNDTTTVTGENVYIVMDKKEMKKPLIIVDGKQVEQLHNIPSDIIDHIEMLKDETSIELYSKIYDCDASNGILLITTKRVKKPADDTSSPVAEAITQTTGDSHSDYEKVYDVVENMPEYPGGMDALLKFLSENIRYPEAAHQAKVEGRVIVTFIVDSDGTIGNARVVRKVSDDLDAEAVRIIGSMPKWKPGTQNGKPVRVKYTLPITFRLQ